MALKIYFDGGCRPNPGHMETAVVARGTTYLERDCGIGDNNDAEWLALLHALRVAGSLGVSDVALIGDSAMIVGLVRPSGASRNPRFRARLDHYRQLAEPFDRVRIRQVGRSQNLAGIALDRLHAGL